MFDLRLPLLHATYTHIADIAQWYYESVEGIFWYLQFDIMIQISYNYRNAKPTSSDAPISR